IELCMAHSLLEITSLTSTPFVVKSNNWQVPAQSAGANAALEHEAAFWALMSVSTASQYIEKIGRGTDPALTLCSGLQVTGESRSYASALSASFVEGFQLYKQVVDKAVEDALAVADSELSSTPSLKIGIARGMSAADLSRSAAAHWLVGGDPGLLGS